jgi:hypothetical protein
VSTGPQRGSTVVATLLAFGGALLFFTLLAQFATWQYARGAVRAAAQEAARAAAPPDAPAHVCVDRFDQVRSGLLGGRLGDGVGPVGCEVDGAVVRVRAEVRFQRWLPISPDWAFTVTAVAVKEQPL